MFQAATLINREKLLMLLFVLFPALLRLLPPLPGKITPLHPDHFFNQGA
jgi:hypothetical protein